MRRIGHRFAGPTDPDTRGENPDIAAHLGFRPATLKRCVTTPTADPGMS